MDAEKNNTEGQNRALELLDDVTDILPNNSTPVPEVIGKINDTISLPVETGTPIAEQIPVIENLYGKDCDGVLWDSNIHFSDGRKTKLGKFRKQKEGMKDGQQNTANITPSETGSMSPAIAGQAFSGLFFSLGAGLLGEEFLPENTQEKRMVEEPIQNYCMATGTKDIPPGIALVLALVAYTGTKLATKKTLREKAIEKFKQIRALFVRV
jgi:hypothetical protein